MSRTHYASPDSMSAMNPKISGKTLELHFSQGRTVMLFSTIISHSRCRPDLGFFVAVVYVAVR